MSIQSEISRINNNVQSTLSIISDAGVPVASGANSDALPDAATALAAMVGGGSEIAISMVLLWQNASPNSEFVGQTVTVDLNNYDRVAIDFMADGATNNIYCVEKPVGSYSLDSYTIPSNTGQTWFTAREVYVNKDGVTFGNGGWKYAGSTAISRGDIYAIPIRIYGIKGVSA